MCGMNFWSRTATSRNCGSLSSDSLRMVLGWPSAWTPERSEYISASTVVPAAARISCGSLMAALDLDADALELKAPQQQLQQPAQLADVIAAQRFQYVSEKVVVRRALRRSQVIGFFEALPPCLIGMEPSRPASKAIAMRSILRPPFSASSRQRLRSFSNALSYGCIPMIYQGLTKGASRR
jgi:hypothetical protein